MTNAPWRVSRTDWRIVVGPDDLAIADVRSDWEDSALIAAAPIMLMALRTIAEVGKVKQTATRIIALEAIAKAEGK